MLWRVVSPCSLLLIGFLCSEWPLPDYIVVGRPITQAEDPVAAYRRCVAEFVG